MSHRMTRLILWLAPVLLMSVFLMGLQTSRSAAQDQKAGTTQKKPARQSFSVTGCLQKGVEAGGYFITAEDGKVWELSSRTVKLDEQVGHKVTLTGYQVHRSKATEEKMAKSEKAEAAGKEYADMRVTSLKMISESCQ
jgi:hypothetical protein